MHKRLDAKKLAKLKQRDLAKLAARMKINKLPVNTLNLPLPQMVDA